ncbi:hypothetical protein FOL47_010034, partial [Perkinsus chesapeaki]
MVSGFEININNDDDQCDNRSKGGIDGVFGIGARFAPCTHFQLSLRSDWALSKLSLKRILLAVCSEGDYDNTKGKPGIDVSEADDDDDDDDDAAADDAADDDDDDDDDAGGGVSVVEGCYEYNKMGDIDDSYTAAAEEDTRYYQMIDDDDDGDDGDDGSTSSSLLLSSSPPPLVVNLHLVAHPDQKYE